MFYIVTIIGVLVACYVGYRLTLHLNTKIED